MTPRPFLAAAAIAHLLAAPPASAADAPKPVEVRTRGCLLAAAEVHRLPPAMLVILLKVEGGRLGHVSQNTNGTVDIGPMQVNTIWVGKVAAHWRATPEAAYLALRDNLCANLEGGAWILAQAMAEARGDFWNGVGIYHSHNPDHRERYLRLVLAASRKLQDQTARAPAPGGATAPPASAADRSPARG